MDKNNTLPNGTILNNTYRIEGVLGQGGFGITYLATDINLNIKVALKEFFPKTFCCRDSISSDIKTLDTKEIEHLVDKFKKKFLKEAKSIASLNHPNIIKIHAAFEQNNTAYYAMDFIEGGSLFDLISENGVLTKESAINYIVKIGSALSYLHNHRINHLDVKPANIMIRPTDNEPILIDFGLAKQYDYDGNQTSSTPVGVSHGYAPIEQYAQGGVSEFSPQADVYSMGATLYFMLSAKPPRQASELMSGSLYFPESFPPELIQIVNKAMAPTAFDRFPTINDFIGAIISGKILPPLLKRGIINDSENTLFLTKNKQRNKTNSRKIIVLSLIFLGVLAIALSIVLFINKQEKESEDTYTNNSIKVETYYSDNLLNLARSGDVEAQFNLGYCYYMGLGIDQDYSKAVEWFTKAAEQGYAEAQLFLGECYEEGKGVKQNDNKAVEYYQMAAMQDNAQAINNLGVCYLNGTGVKQNDEEAFNLFSKAANLGLAVAQTNLGDCYYYGRGTQQNKILANEWYEKAAQQVNNNSFKIEESGYYKEAKEKFDLGYNYYFHDQEGLGAQLIKEAADAGYAKAQYYMGEFYVYSEIFPPDPEQSISWYKKSAEQGYPPAQLALGSAYNNGKILPQDKNKAQILFKSATQSLKALAKNGDAEAQYYLSNCYYSGTGVPEDSEEGFKWLLESAKNNYVDAQSKLGEKYYKGYGIPQNKSLGIFWMEKAAAQGDHYSAEFLDNLPY